MLQTKHICRHEKIFERYRCLADESRLESVSKLGWSDWPRDSGPILEKNRARIATRIGSESGQNRAL